MSSKAFALNHHLKSSMDNPAQDTFFLIFIAILIWGIYVGITSPLVCAITILIVLIKTSKHTAGFYLMLYGGILGGTIRSMYPFIPFYGLLLNFIGFILVYKLFKRREIKIKSSISYLIITFFVFFISFLYGPKTSYSLTKLISLIQNGLFFFFAYFTLARSNTIKIKDAAILLILTSVYLISCAVDNYHIHPDNFFDFNWFRNGLMNIYYSTGEDPILSYQEVGMDATYAAALICSIKKTTKRDFIYIAFGSILTLISGARQSLLALIIMIFLRYAVFNEVKSLKKVFLIISSFLFLLIVFLSLKLSNIDIISNTLENGDETRSIIWLFGINIFLENPILGTGLGGYATYGPGDLWPHNFFLEILSELGVVGLICFIAIVTNYIKTHKVSIKHTAICNIYYFLPITPLFVRFMVSGDFSLSIALFSAIFATTGIIHKKLQNEENDKL